MSTDHPQTTQPPTIPPPAEPAPDPSTGPLALVVQPDGTATLTRLPEAGLPVQDRQQLAAIQDTVKGEFEALGNGRWLLLVNAARHELLLPVNERAGLLATSVGLRTGGIVLGPAMFISHEGSELADVSPTVVEFARQMGVIA